MRSSTSPNAVATPADPQPAGRPRGADAKVIVHIDHAALVRGHTDAGETCEIAGVGPVPVSVVHDMMADAFLAAVVTDGVDVYNVVHLGRQATALQRTALEVRERTCARIGCHVRYPLEIDHVRDWTDTKVTQLVDLARFYPDCQDLKTYLGWTVIGPPTGRQFIPPKLAGRLPDGPDRPDGPDP
ncbi:MAG: DUF222 domain-containing protein [Acidimicrobiales bacterium]